HFVQVGGHHSHLAGFGAAGHTRSSGTRRTRARRHGRRPKHVVSNCDSGRCALMHIIKHMQCKMFPLAMLAATSLLAADTGKRLSTSAEVFKEIMDMADRAIPQKLLDKAECVIIVPGLLKGAFLVGGKYGRGFVVCRREAAGWGPPAGI